MLITMEEYQTLVAATMKTETNVFIKSTSVSMNIGLALVQRQTKATKRFMSLFGDLIEGEIEEVELQIKFGEYIIPHTDENNNLRFIRVNFTTNLHVLMQ